MPVSTFSLDEVRQPSGKVTLGGGGVSILTFVGRVDGDTFDSFVVRPRGDRDVLAPLPRLLPFTGNDVTFSCS